MLDVAVNEPPHNEEAITYTVVDPETGHEETQFSKGIVKNQTHLRRKPCEDAFNPTKESQLNTKDFPLAGS